MRLRIALLVWLLAAGVVLVAQPASASLKDIEPRSKSIVCCVIAEGALNATLLGETHHTEPATFARQLRNALIETNALAEPDNPAAFWQAGLAIVALLFSLSFFWFTRRSHW